MESKTALIIGAGPAGLTAAYELLARTDIRPIIFESSQMVGGISRTVNYKGNRIDIGGHRFFSKSDRVMDWWLEMLPIEDAKLEEFAISYQGKQRTMPANPGGANPEETDEIMLVRNRKSRIFFLRKFFDYPIKLKPQTIRNLGLARMSRIMASYMRAKAMPIRDEQNLEQFFINRFGRELYQTFFKSYTEKVWGVPCHEISAEWGAQRIKGLSITKAVTHALSRAFKRDRSLGQKKIETSLIERFLYPKFGPGQMWETCADKVRQMGGEILMESTVEKLLWDGNRVEGIVARDSSGDEFTLFGDYVFSTMPVKHLLRSMGRGVPEHVRTVGEGLVYRDFITVGLLVEDLEIKEQTKEGNQLLKDNWIYIQEPDVMVGRLQIFNNWSPYMVADRRHVWLGMEYFCNTTDELWNKSDEQLKELGKQELEKLGFIKASKALDATVIKMPKTYPAYFGAYDQFDIIRDFVDPIENLFLVGRNGMHRYNNQDHSMLAAMVAVDNILEGRIDKSNIWDVNAESEYHEQVDHKPGQVATEETAASGSVSKEPAAPRETSAKTTAASSAADATTPSDEPLTPTS